MDEKKVLPSGLADCHLHTRYSFDSQAEPEAILTRANQLGLTACCITDHCEANDPDPDRLLQDMKHAVQAVTALREGAFADSGTRILTGLEIGQPLQNKAFTRRVLEEIKVDFVIGSLHNVAGEEDFYYLEYTEKRAEELLNRYFSELIEMVQWGRFDALGHLTYPLRYIVGKHRIPLDMAQFDPQIDTILRLLAEGQKGLEINTSGLRNEIGETAPTLPYVKRFRALGGRYVTLGSDAHDPQSVGMGLAEAAEIARAAGFSAITYYVAHQPIEIPLI